MLRSSLLLLAALALLPVANARGQAAPAPEVHRGRGVYYFEGGVPCPLAGVGTRGHHACNRVALFDGNTTVTIDRAHHRIVLHNPDRYDQKQPIADLVLLGVGKTAQGVSERVGVHLKIEKKHDAFDAKVHSHVRDWEERIASAQLEPFEVVLEDGRSTTVALTPETALHSVRKPGLAARLAGALVEVKDNLPKVKPAPGTRPLADVSIGVGVGPVVDNMLRAELTLLDGSKGSLATLQSSSWRLRLTSLSSFLPKSVLQRDLFFFGLEDLPLLAPVRRDGLKKGQSLTFSMEGGKGKIQLGNVTQEFGRATEIARAFLEFSFLGAILTQHAEQNLLRGR